MYPKDEVKEKEMLFETQKRGLKMLEIVIKREGNFRMIAGKYVR